MCYNDVFNINGSLKKKKIKNSKRQLHTIRNMFMANVTVFFIISFTQYVLHENKGVS